MIRIVALTEAGEKLAKQIQQLLPEQSDIWFKPKPFTAQVQQAFQAGERLILICATGIAVRTLAPVLAHKNTDPAVLVLDEAGQFVIPLLSGHEGGANDWADNVASLIEAQLVANKTNTLPVFSYFNLSQVETNGLEFNTSFRPNSKLEIKAGYQLLFAFDRDIKNRFKTELTGGISV